MHKLFDLSGKTAVITGGTGVLGSAMAKGLAEAGTGTVVIGRRRDAGDQLIQSLESKGFKALFVQADVLDAGELTKAKEKIIREFGTIDILVQ
jgi:NAD(P)-dependent dehydrogenase (short-subunit alcohol dehydrogenase family)